jgi:hypothetical protein
LEINCECFIDTISTDAGMEVFANFVYEDFMGIQNKKDMHLIKEFIFYSYNETTKKTVKKGWSEKQIRKNKNEFLKEVIANAKEMNSIYWKGYCRVELFENEDLSETLEDLKGVYRK